MNTRPDGAKKHVKRPIRRSLLIVMISMFAVLCILISIIASVFFSKALYSQFDSKLTGVIAYIESNVDADDLETCIQAGVTSAKYDETQQFLNKLVDSIGVEYIYLVIPEEDTIVNVVTATSSEEFEAGQDNLPILFEADWFTKEEIAKFRSYWDSEGMNFFEETDSYEGVEQSRYTACKSLKNSGGKTVALICVDLDSTDLRAMVTRTVVISIVIVAVVFIIFGMALGLWLYHNVTEPLRVLEASAYKFASVKSDTGELEYTAPDIRSSNEVGSLAEAIKKMTSDIKNYIKEREEAEIKIHVAEEENIRLAEKAEAAAKISELSQSVYDLLNNLPALTFYKDTAGGKYLGCNQAFAAYAGKASPADVIGLTDYDMFAEKDADHFVEVDKIVMGLDHPYVILETAPDSDGVVRTFQTTKLKFKDASGEERLLGLCIDLTEMASAKRETEQALEAYEAAMSSSLTYSGIARALSTDYTYIYYVNIESEEYIEYRNELSKESITEEKRGSGFFAQSVKDAESLLYKDDRKEFLSVFNKDNLIKKIDTTGAFTYTYRLMIEGVPTYMNLKATRIKDDPEHIVIGVYNVDAEMKGKEAIERYKEERITFARIAALSSDFICIYTVDPETDCYSEYMATSEYEGLGLAKEGDSFFDAPYRDNASSIWYEDREMFLSMVTKENVLKEIKEHGLFVLNYRIVVNEEPLYVALKAAIVEERDGPQLIVGVSNIDAQVKREKEYDYNLSMARNQANIDALTGVKNKHAYLDAEAKLNGQIEDGSIKEFALVVFDVNELKLANDTYGHRVGDELLREACMIICHQFKHSPVYRIGGDEFAVIAKGQDYENIDELVSGIDEINLKSRAEKGAVVACGMAKYKNEQNVAELFEKADVAMYENKRKLKQ